MKCTEYISKLTLTMENYLVTNHFFVVNMPDTNVVMGLVVVFSWSCPTNYRALEMEFTSLDGKLVLLRGMHSCPPQTMLANQMEANLRRGDIT